MVTAVAPERLREKREVNSKAVILLSGGIDSTTLLYDLVSQGYKVFPISFYYGQKHDIEVANALATCTKLKLSCEVIKLEALRAVAPSALTRSDREVPNGHYTDEVMKKTVVPNRNMVLISLATSYAIGIGAAAVFYAAHGGDHAIYPDCRPEFLIALNKAIKLCDYERICLEAPYMYWRKADIVKRGIELGVDYSLTWSCYKGRHYPCGTCGTCVERLEAFELAGIKDPLEYQ